MGCVYYKERGREDKDAECSVYRNMDLIRLITSVLKII